VFFALSHRFPRALNWSARGSMESRFIALVRDYRPDLIVSVHPGFVGCALDLLEKHRLEIPFVSLIADLVTFSSLWVDKRCRCTISPTAQATQILKSMGIPAASIAELGFPIRRRFETPSEVFDRRIARRQAGAPLGILVFANAFPKARTRKLVSTLLGIEGARVTVITGRDDRLKDSLARAFAEQLGTRVALPGYVTDMERHMAENDLLITRAGPNTLLESVSCGLRRSSPATCPGRRRATRAGSRATGWESPAARSPPCRAPSPGCWPTTPAAGWRSPKRSAATPPASPAARRRSICSSCSDKPARSETRQGFRRGVADRNSGEFRYNAS
jgi:processive 1,2-diacylglycerol beta-glucosyltransferase